MDAAFETRVRSAAFDWLDGEARRNDGVFEFARMRAGFELDGQRISLMNQPGIFRPRGLALPISITTAPPKPGKPRPYDDSIGADGIIRYRYRGVDPRHADNVGLRETMRLKVPLIYFHGVVPGRYGAAYPVLIVDDEPAALTFRVQADVATSFVDAQRIAEVADDVAVAERRRYHTVLVAKRLHQQAFRERVLRAYGELCAICRLRRARLLDAAHIRPDSEGGKPEVWNGIAMCKLHHAAFDQDLIGIQPKRLVIEVRRDVLDEEDGPMLRHGLQGVHGVELALPRAKSARPSAIELEYRYEEFRRAI